MIVLKAHAKINLTLDITGILDNGYHELAMIMQSVSLHDTLTISSDAETFSFTSTNSRLPLNDNNLIVKAAKLFFDKFSVPENVRIHLKKRIPISAGLAGGSADAAAVLVGLNKLYGCNASVEELQELGLSLGADVPFCISGGTALCEGVGEIISPLPNIPDCYILIAKPPQSMSTPRAFSLFDSFVGYLPDIDNESVIKGIKNNDLDSLSPFLANKLQAITEREHPIVNQLVLIMSQSGAKASVMSGSGTAVYGIFDSRIIAEKCQNKLPKQTVSHITTPASSGVTFTIR